MLPMAEIPWSDPYPYDDEQWPPPPPIPWTRAWCREQQQRALEHGHAFYEARYDYDAYTAPILAVGTAPMCPGCGVALPLAETMHAFARTAFAVAQHAPKSCKLSSYWYSGVCACGVSCTWELWWQSYGAAWDLRWRHHHLEQPCDARPDGRLTFGVAVCSADRHHATLTTPPTA
jgi:hypothetical protein